MVHCTTFYFSKYILTYLLTYNDILLLLIIWYSCYFINKGLNSKVIRSILAMIRVIISHTVYLFKSENKHIKLL